METVATHSFKSHILSLFLVVLPVASTQADEVVFNLGPLGVLTLDVPQGWSFEILPSTNTQPATIRIDQEDSGQFEVLITPFMEGPSTPPNFSSPDNVRLAVESLAELAILRAAEDQLTVEPLGVGNIGYMYSATDKTLVGRPITPGEFLYVVQGIVVVGELLCTFSILTNERPSGVIDAAMMMLGTAAHRIDG